jgi:hypothetical protein
LGSSAAQSTIIGANTRLDIMKPNMPNVRQLSPRRTFPETTECEMVVDVPRKWQRQKVPLSSEAELASLLSGPKASAVTSLRTLLSQYVT